MLKNKKLWCYPYTVKLLIELDQQCGILRLKIRETDQIMVGY